MKNQDPFTMILYPLVGSPYELGGDSVEDLIAAANQDRYRSYRVENQEGEVVFKLDESFHPESLLPSYLKKQLS